MQLAGLQSNKAGINFDRNVAEVDLGDQDLGDSDGGLIIHVFPKCLGRVMYWVVPSQEVQLLSFEGGGLGIGYFFGLCHFSDSLFT